MTSTPPFRSVLIANRGEIASRIISTVQRMGMRAIAVYSDADAGLPYVAAADASVAIGPAPAAESYLQAERVISAAVGEGADAIHPGYGFLSENADFARRVTHAGLSWVGPTPEAMDAMSDKIQARNAMQAAGVPVAPGSRGPVATAAEALAEAERIGYPVMLKASAGGGGIGMIAVDTPGDLPAAFESARGKAARFFASADMLVERYFPNARHVEVQIIGLPDGTILTLPERDCSAQRRNQKVVEESPSPAMSAVLRQRLSDIGLRAGRAVGYRNLGTVECLVSGDDIVFLEMNTRLQVEHTVTELVTGRDLVEDQLLIAAGRTPNCGSASIEASGHAFEFRVYAEDPVRFLPSPGVITSWRPPTGDGIRVDAGYAEGTTVSPFYDPLLAKLCVHGADRADALALAGRALDDFIVEGPKTNLPFLRRLIRHEPFAVGRYDTSVIASMS